GYGRGVRQDVPLGRGGVLVVFDGTLDPRLAWSLRSLAPILRRRRSEERLEQMTMQLARRNQALEDFAALVAHELKNPLHAALVADDPSGPLEQAFGLVETLLEAARDEVSEWTFASAAECLDRAVEDLRADGVEITAELTAALPLPSEPLRVVLRNLLAN